MGFVAGGVLLASCGPTISEMRQGNYPAREASCNLEFVTMNSTSFYTDGKWEVIGQLVLEELGSADPLAERYRAIVRPRACAMGGEAVAIFMAGTSETLGSKSTTSYAVLRHAAQPGQAHSRRRSERTSQLSPARLGRPSMRVGHAPPLPPCCHAHPDSTALTGTRRNGTGTATREIDCKTAPHLGLDRLGLADSIPVPPTKAQRCR